MAVKDLFTAARYVLAIALIVYFGRWPVFWRQLSFLILLAVVTYPVRSVRWGMIYNFFLIGFLWTWVIVGAEYVIEALVLREGAATFRHAVVAPGVEEPLKIVPLLLAMAVGRWRFRHSYGATDLMNLGAALGAGVAFFETLLVGRPFAGVQTSPRAFGYALVPDALSGYVGHAASTGLIALAIGYLLYAIRWRKAFWLGAVFAMLVAAWVMADHGLHNWAVDGSGRAFENAMRAWGWIGRGVYTPHILIALVLATVAVERFLLWRMLRPFPKAGLRRATNVFAPLRRSIDYGAARATALRMKALLLYVLTMRQLGYLRAHAHGDRAVDRKAIGDATARRTGEMLGYMHTAGLLRS